MIFFIYGQDTFRSKQKLSDLKAKFIKEVDPRGDSIKIINGEKTDITELSQAIGASSLFVKKRLIIIENISLCKDSETIKNLRDYLKSRSEQTVENDNIIIFIDEDSGDKMGRNVLWQYLLKQQFVQNFQPLSATGASLWIKNKASELGGQLTQVQANKISGMFGNDLWRIESELKKLINYKRGLHEKLLGNEIVKIDDQDMDNMARGKIDENIFALTDAIGNRNKPLALRLLEKEIEAGMAEAYLLNMIQRQFRILLQVRQGIDSGLTQRQITTTLKIHPYVAQKSMKQVSTYSLEFLKKIFLQLILLDRDLKVGRASFKVSLDLMIAKL